MERGGRQGALSWPAPVAAADPAGGGGELLAPHHQPPPRLPRSCPATAQPGRHPHAANPRFTPAAFLILTTLPSHHVKEPPLRPVDPPVALRWFLVPGCNSRLFLNKRGFAGRITGCYLCEVHTTNTSRTNTSRRASLVSFS